MKLHAILLIGLLTFVVGCGDKAVEQSSDSDESQTPAQTSAADPNLGDEVNSDTGSQDKAIVVDARVLLAECLASAKTEDKKVLVHFGSPS